MLNPAPLPPPFHLPFLVAFVSSTFLGGETPRQWAIGSIMEDTWRWNLTWKIFRNFAAQTVPLLRRSPMDKCLHGVIQRLVEAIVSCRGKSGRYSDNWSPVQKMRSVMWPLTLAWKVGELGSVPKCFAFSKCIECLRCTGLCEIFTEHYNGEHSFQDPGLEQAFAQKCPQTGSRMRFNVPETCLKHLDTFWPFITKQY